MRRITTIGRATFAALALTILVAACGDDRSPTQLAERNAETPEPATDNPWTSIFAAAEALGSPVTVTFAGASDRSFRVGKLDPSSAVPEDGPESAQAVCAIGNPSNRGELDAFRQCMARALQEDVCRSGGSFVLQGPTPVATAWRAYCPASPEVEEDEDEDDRDDDPGAKQVAASAPERPAVRFG